MGTAVQLYAVLDRSSVVLFFYPRAFSPICTAEVCTFRDHARHFEEANSAIFGVSSDSAAIARRFADVYRLPFPLLLDKEGHVRKLYGVRKTLGLLPGRVTFVIGRDRMIRQVTQSAFRGTIHVTESLKELCGR
jgi:thioredoxin-dependent peroxiredoxin